ncbi:TPA: hypothetical protein ACJYEE_000199 [Neisseria gonorrhoeae]|uniref:hypothetical protein n=1 Tax=Neisseria gonorrhoeae TaxID=485 RepID=UPI003850839D
MKMKKLILLSVAAMLVTACTYADRRFVTQESAAEIQVKSRAIQISERAERAEYRKERREEMMDAARAIKKANENSPNIYFIR